MIPSFFSSAYASDIESLWLPLVCTVSAALDLSNLCKSTISGTNMIESFLNDLTDKLGGKLVSCSIQQVGLSLGGNLKDKAF